MTQQNTAAEVEAARQRGEQAELDRRRQIEEAARPAGGTAGDPVADPSPLGQGPDGQNRG